MRSHSNRLSFGLSFPARLAAAREDRWWRSVEVIALALLLAALLGGMFGCITTPDGRRVLHPTAGAILGDVLACGGGLALSAIGGSPDYAAAATCHLDRVASRLSTKPSPNRPTPAPSLERGELVLEAAAAEQRGDRATARKLAGQCEAMARAELAGMTGIGTDSIDGEGEASP